MILYTDATIWLITHSNHPKICYTYSQLGSLRKITISKYTNVKMGVQLWVRACSDGKRQGAAGGNIIIEWYLYLVDDFKYLTVFWYDFILKIYSYSF